MPGHLGSPGQYCNSRPACASWTCTCAPGRNAIRLSRGLSGDLALLLCIGARRLPPPGYSQVKVLSGPGDPRLPWAARPPSSPPPMPLPLPSLGIGSLGASPRASHSPAPLGGVRPPSPGTFGLSWSRYPAANTPRLSVLLPPPPVSQVLSAGRRFPRSGPRAAGVRLLFRSSPAGLARSFGFLQWLSGGAHCRARPASFPYSSFCGALSFVCVVGRYL